MISKLIKPLLMYPEPEDTGSGAPAATENADTVETQTDDVQTDTKEDNPFSSLFDPQEEETENPAEDKQDDDGYSLGLGKDDGFDDDEVVMLTDLCKKHNLPAESASAFLKDVYAEADKRGKQEEQNAFLNATKQLQEKWGDKFEANARKAGTVIRQIGNRLGWSEERMKSMLNPHDVELMHEIARYMGNSGTRGLGNPAPATKPMTSEQIDNMKKNLIMENMKARQLGNIAEMKRTSDEHFELCKKQKGDKAVRILPSGY